MSSKERGQPDPINHKEKQMNSCRNCTNAKHDGAFNPALYCKDLRTQVAPATSMSTEENKAQDKRLINRANTCGAYKGEAND